MAACPGLVVVVVVVLATGATGEGLHLLQVRLHRG